MSNPDRRKPAARNRQGLDTRLIHAGEPRPRIGGAVTMPVFQSSTFEPEPGASYHDLGYIRLSTTPNHRVLHDKLADLEGAEAALVTGSGMAAITTSLLTLLAPGDHLLAGDCLYGGTHGFLTQELAAQGIEFDLIDGDAPDTWSALVRPRTRLVYVETMTNPLLQVADLEAIVRFAAHHGLLTLIDNTFATPVNFRPLEHGFDLVLHSGTKYLNGHNDIVAGALLGRGELVERIKHRLDHLGGVLDPHACFLLHRGLKTLGLRVRRHNENAIAVARHLADHPAVARVYYPGLPAHPQHDRAVRLFEGCGGVLSFEPRGGPKAVARMMAALELPAEAPSLGGVDSLITVPALTSHAGIPPEERSRLGISDALVRLAIGIENAEDLIADFDQALAG